jgi:hypothetical protein
MFRLFTNYAIVLALAFSASLVSYGQNMHWSNVGIVAGGFVTGIIYHPTEQGLAYARTDMGGAYRLDPVSQAWQPISDQFSSDDWNMYGVESMAIDPTNPSRVYMACGTYAFNNWSGNASFFSSNDKGTTWQRTNFNFKLGANEDGRGMGERLALDPNSPETLFLGTRQNGLWKTTNRGASWSQVTSFPTISTPKDVGLGFVTIDKNSGNAHTPSKNIYVGVARPGNQGANLYRSKDGGTTWSAVPNAPSGSLMPYQAKFASNGIMYLTYNDGPGPNGISTGEVWKLNTTNDTWTRILTPNGSQGGFAGLAVDPQNPNTLMVGTICRWWPSDEIYRSTNAGASWTAIGTGAKITRDASASPYLRWGKTDADLSTGNWVSAFAIDPFNSDKTMYATGATVWGTDQLTNADKGLAMKWVVKARGIEQTAVLSLVSPNAGPNLLSGMGDICGFVHHDIYQSPSQGMIDPSYKNAESVDFAENNPSKFVIIGHDYEPKYFGSYSNNAGATWTKFTTIPNGAKDGMISLNTTGSVIVWAPNNMAPHRSENNGASWSAVSGLNGSATLVSDRANANKFYAIQNNTFYKSTDAGKNFTSVTSSGFSGTKLKAVPGMEDHVWIPASNGLYKTTNAGNSFTKITNVQSVNAVGFGKAAPGNSYPAVYIVGTANNLKGIYRSDDAGSTWVRINDDLHQFGNAGAAITGDPRVYGRVYLATNGRGIVLGEITDCAGVPNGSAYIDQCTNCVGGTTGETDCTITGINTASTQIEILSYPNPFNHSTSIALKDGILINNLKIFNSTGILISQFTNVNKPVVELGETLSSGIYTIHIQTDGGNYITKVIKQ